MATTKKTNPRQTYTVVVPFQCPNRKEWHKKGDEVELLLVEAEPLLFDGKVESPKVASSKKGDS